MEGRYFYSEDKLSKDFARAIRQQKDKWKICSLSRAPHNTLMWSCYSGGHKGIALGIKVRDVQTNRCKVEPVKHDMELNLDSAKIRAGAEVAALHILSQKQSAWHQEQEVRVFSRTRFVNVEIQRVCFGCLVDPTDQELITALARETAPHAKLVKINRSELDKPVSTFSA